jgi:hypothetical protein
MSNSNQFKSFTVQAAQGDVLLRRVDQIPSSAKEKKFVSGVVVAHSETGHHHSFAKNCGVTYFETNDPTVAFLRVDSASLLEHHRSFDTHAAILFSPGNYELRRPTEYVSAAEKRIVQD